MNKEGKKVREGCWRSKNGKRIEGWLMWKMWGVIGSLLLLCNVQMVNAMGDDGSMVGVVGVGVVRGRGK